VVSALLLAPLLALTACAGERDHGLDVLVPPATATPAVEAAARPPESSLSSETYLAGLDPRPVPGAEWLRWHPTYTHVRKAGARALAKLGNLVAARNASEWTATDELRGVTVAYTPSHVRVSVPRAEFYLDLGPSGPAPTYVMCLERSCVDAGAGVVTWGPELTNAYLETMAAYVRDVVSRQAHLGVFARRGPTMLATVDTPDGPLACVVHAPELALLQGLEGTDVRRGPGTRAARQGVVPSCVDAHGLVVPVDANLPTGGWSGFSEGVSGDVEGPQGDVVVDPPGM
jgi:hypothetical protein